MTIRKFILLLLTILTVGLAHAKHVPDSVMHRDGLYVDNMKIYNDSAIFQGVNLKLDLFNTIYYLAKTQAKLQTYEIAFNVRLKQRYYPTIELGYTNGSIETRGTEWMGQGGWTSVGLDFNGLKKGLESQNALLVGLRVGTAIQQYDLKNVSIDDYYWKSREYMDFTKQFHTDCWGEVVAGCQVQVYGGLMMGWYLRLKLLFTRNVKNDEPYPYFIPGFGYRDYTQWGISYYVGWKL